MVIVKNVSKKWLNIKSIRLNKLRIYAGSINFYIKANILVKKGLLHLQT